MEISRFWALIDEARQATDGTRDSSPSALPESLQAVLREQESSELQGFVRTFNGLLCDLNTWELWGAGYVLAGGMSDDSFHYFRSWIIGKGQEAFDTAATDPDALVSYIGTEAEFDNELLEYVAIEVLEERGIDDPREQEPRNPDGDPTGEPWDEDTVGDLYPRLVELSRQLGNWE